MLNEGEIYQALVELVDEATSKEHVFNLVPLRKPAEEFLRKSGINTFEIAAKAFVKKLDKARRPKFRDGQLTFFEDSWIPVARNLRVKMAHATAEDILAWDNLERGTLDRHSVSYNVGHDYRENVLRLFSNELITLKSVYEVYPNLEKDGNVYASPEWIALRDSVLEDAKYECADCQGTAETVHHTTYVHGIICDKQFLIPLCWPCHRKRHPGKSE